MPATSVGTLAGAPSMDLGHTTKPLPTHMHANHPPAGPVPSQVVRTAVSLEYAALRHRGHCPLGMYVTPSIEDLLVWDAVFFVHRGERVEFPRGA
jgi:hypothetical protein